MTIIEPIHVATINGKPLRFFRSPNNDGRPDFPWHSVDDLMLCVGLPRDKRRYLKNAHFKAGARVVATADDIVTIAPHVQAQGFLDAMVETGRTTPAVKDDYTWACKEALDKLIPEFTSGDELIKWTAAAFHRHDDDPPLPDPEAP